MACGHRRFFTVIEFLFSVAIIAVLASILMPNLAESRDRARFARWLQFNKQCSTDPSCVVNFNFQEGDGGVLNNSAKGYEGEGFNAADYNGIIKGDYQWAQGRWWKGKKAVLDNFKRTINPETTNYTIVYDNHRGSIKNTFLKDEPNVYEIDAGIDGKSFVETLNYVFSQNFDDDTIIYLLEDDYIHRPEWDKILMDGFTLPVEYVTLYDHGDKNQEMYKDFMTKVLCTEFSHWMPTPSTTSTFACKFRTLRKDADIHIKYSVGYKQRQDHASFMELHQRKRVLISSLPGYSTHSCNHALSPCIDWEKYI